MYVYGVCISIYNVESVPAIDGRPGTVRMLFRVCVRQRDWTNIYVDICTGNEREKSGRIGSG